MKRIFCTMCLMACFVLIAGCGGSSGTDTTNQTTSTDLTNAEQQGAMAGILSEDGINKAVEDIVYGGSAQTLSASPAKEPVTVGCLWGGTITVNFSSVAGSSTYTADFDHCILDFHASDLGSESGQSFYLELTGRTTSGSGASTFENLQAHIVPHTGPGEITCMLNGTNETVSASADPSEGVSVHYNLLDECGSTRFTHTGDILAWHEGGVLYNTGDAVYTLQGARGGRIVRCQYNRFDTTNALCADYAAACGLTAATACNPGS
jgi:hypothetical protein